MDQQQPPYGEPTAPDLLEQEPASGRRPGRGLLVGLVTAAVVAAGATGVALASDSPSPSPSGSSGSSTAPSEGPRAGGPGKVFRHFGGPGLELGLGAVHGELTVPKKGGGYQTVVLQRGSVTAVSSDSITVKSADGFTASYDVPADAWVNAKRDGLGSIDKGTQVMVVAQKKSGNDKALRVVDLSDRPGPFGGKMFRGPGDDRRHGPSTSESPNPSGSGSASTSGFAGI
jgi:hypothetical protein